MCMKDLRLKRLGRFLFTEQCLTSPDYLIYERLVYEFSITED